MATVSALSKTAKLVEQNLRETASNRFRVHRDRVRRVTDREANRFSWAVSQAYIYSVCSNCYLSFTSPCNFLDFNRKPSEQLRNNSNFSIKNNPRDNMRLSPNTYITLSTLSGLGNIFLTFGRFTNCVYSSHKSSGFFVCFTQTNTV